MNSDQLKALSYCMEDIGNFLDVDDVTVNLVFQGIINCEDSDIIRAEIGKRNRTLKLIEIVKSKRQVLTLQVNSAFLLSFSNGWQENTAR